MLETPQRERLLDRLGLPPAGRRLVLDAAKFAPIRQVASKGRNVVTPYQSWKMQRPVETESRHLEFPAAVGYEQDPSVLEYFMQPCRLRFEVVDADGEIHIVDHTPDALVITEHGIWIDEWKLWRKVEGLARRHPWRYQLGSDGRWYAAGIEQWLAERGIGYRIRTDQDIPRRRVENILFLEDYLHPSADRCPVDVAMRVRDTLAAQPVLFLAELYEQAECRPDDAFQLIADGLLVADIDVAALKDPTQCRVFRDEAVREFEHARTTPTAFPVPGVVHLSDGARLVYNHQSYTLAMLGTSKAVLTSDDGKPVEIPIETLEQLAASRDLLMDAASSSERSERSLCDFSAEELRMAVSRRTQLEHITKPNRSQRRHLKAIAIARMTGTDELVALVPRIRDRGNRQPRLTPEQEAAIDEIIKTVYLTNRAAGYRHCYKKLLVLCAERHIKAPSYPVLIQRIKALPQEESDRARHGKRVAYQNAEFVTVLHVDTPVHGSRAFQYVHLDHTQLDIELVAIKTGESLGRPWLSLAIDAFTRRILGIYLSYDPPSYRSNMMLLRDMVRRHRRLPQFIVVDNGADFRCEDFKQFAELMHIHVRYRPAGQPRAGAVMERIFGRLNTEYIHNLAGNTKALRNVRQTTGKFLPSRLAEWTLETMYFGIEYWAFTYYDQCEHSALGLSPREAFERSIACSGERAHRIVTLTPEFIILTCPTVARAGARTVDRQRGIKVNNNYYYWCPEFRDPKLHGKKLPVRYDPWDASTVYVQIDKRWVPARCNVLAQLGRMTDKERELFTADFIARHPTSGTSEPTLQRLSEFLQTFEPEGAARLALERQQENRELYEMLNLASISRTSQPDAITAGLSLVGAKPAHVQPLCVTSTGLEVAPANTELLDFDTF